MKAEFRVHPELGFTRYFNASGQPLHRFTNSTSNSFMATDHQSDPEDDLSILSGYKKIYTDFSNEDVIDMEHRMQGPMFAMYRLEIAVPYFNGVIPRSRQPLYSIVFILTGAGEITVGDFNFKIRDRMLFIVPAKSVHYAHYQTLKCSGFLLNFDIDFFSDKAIAMRTVLQHKIFKHVIKPYLYLDPAQTDTLTPIFESIHQEFRGIRENHLEMVEIKMLELFINLDRLFISAGQIGDEIDHHVIFEQFIDFVEGNYRKERSVQYYARLLRVHPNHLNYLVKKHSGHTAKENIIRRIINEAKHLLLTTRQPIKDIAVATGFSDPNNFSTFFQKHAGCSPVAFREGSGTGN